MRELERDPSPSSAHAPSRRVTIVGAGRVGRAMAAALTRAGIAVDGPLGHNAPWPATAPDAVLLCVGDAAIADTAAGVPAGPAVGHCSGATGLEVLGEREAFSLHPLMTVTDDADAGVFDGAAAAIDATTPAGLQLASDLAAAAGMRPLRIAAPDRAAYHAAASVASNFLVTLEAAAEEIGATAGLQRADLAALVRATVDNWLAFGPRRALTGPVARGDEATVTRQRTAIAERAPQLIGLFDALTAATRRLAAAETAPC